MDIHQKSHRAILSAIARDDMQERGLVTDFLPAVQAELQAIKGPAAVAGPGIRDLRHLLWCSVDNDESRDLDQLSYAEDLADERVKVLVAIADVTSLAPKGSAIDERAQQNTTSVYTPAVIFPMLPEKLSADLTSLNEVDRLAIVVEMIIGPDGNLEGSDVYQAAVRNQARLAYNSLAAWLENRANMPEKIAAVPGMAETIRLQDRAAQRMKRFRHAHGALTLETIEVEPQMVGDAVVLAQSDHKNRANEMIENLMIAANGVTARFLSQHHSPSIRRVVLAPRRWDRIVDIADDYGVELPKTPDSVALETFLVRQKAARPKHFADLSLAVIKLIGPGEYVAELPDDVVPDHFSLAARDYTHSTAPNRRYTDLITQRLIKAVLAGENAPYAFDELKTLAKHCTRQEDEAQKVERQVNKSAAALLLEHQLGSVFDALVTGASEKGTWVRLLQIPVEGRLSEGYRGVDVGDKVRVELISVDVEQGFIDFKRVGPARRTSS